MAAVRVHPRKGMLQFLITKPPVATLDGTPHELAWGQESAITTSEGEHALTVHFPYLGRDAGKATIRVQAGEPGPLVAYKTPFFVTSAGKLTVT